MRTPRSWYVILLLMVSLFGGALFLQHRMVERFYTEPDQYRDALYVPSEGYLRAVTVGYDQFFADFFWLRMIQMFAAGWTRPGNAEQMMSYFDGITDLDPRSVPVYLFGIMAVGESGKRDDMVQQIVEKSFRTLPMRWEVAHAGAFYAFWNMDNPELARFYIQVAVLSPECPEYLRGWVGFFTLKEGRYQAAYQKYMVDLIKSRLSGNMDFDQIQMNHLRRVVDEWYSSLIAEKARAWHAQHGTVPTVEQLREAGAFDDVELPNWGAILPFLINLAEAQESGAQLQASTDEEIREFIGQFIQRGPQAMAVGPYDSMHEGYTGYALWPFVEGDDPLEVITVHELTRRYQNIVDQFALALEEYKEKNNGQCPSDPAEALLFLKDFKDPLGGSFYVDQTDCTLKLTSIPNLNDFYIEVP